MSKPNWKQHRDGVRRYTGDVSPEQESDYYQVRYTDHQLKAVVDVSFYAVQQASGYGVERQTDKTVCRDVRQPGDTEEWSDAEYTILTRRPFTSVKAAEAEAAKLAARHRAGDITWNGLPPWGRG